MKNKYSLEEVKFRTGVVTLFAKKEELYYKSMPLDVLYIQILVGVNTIRK